MSIRWIFLDFVAVKALVFTNLFLALLPSILDILWLSSSVELIDRMGLARLYFRHLFRILVCIDRFL